MKEKPKDITSKRPIVKKEKKGKDNTLLAAIIIAIAILFSNSLVNLAVIDPEQLAGINQSIEIISPIESNGAIPVNIQDQTTPPLDLFFIQPQQFTTLSNESNINNHNINVTNVTNCDAGDYIGVFEAAADRYYFGEAMSVVGYTITLDTPLDYNFTKGDNVICGSRDLNVDGSTTPQIFEVRGAGAGSTLEVDIVRIMFKMICTDVPEFSMFCDIAGGLTNGIYLRVVDGDTRNLFNIKTNGEMANLMYDVSFYDQNKLQGVNGIVGRFTYGGQSKHGVTIRLGAGDRLQLVVQDDLTNIVSFRMIAEGHIVTD